MRHAVLPLLAAALFMPVHAEAQPMTYRVAAIAAVDLAGITPMLAIDGDRLTGFAGCNRIRGRLVRNGAEATITAVAATRMACKGPAMTVERALLDGLAATARIEEGGGEVRLIAGDGRLLLTLVPQG